MAKPSKKFKIIQNPALAAALNGYQPEFGNQQDIWIRERMGQLEKKLADVDNTILRGKPDNHTPKMKEILFIESGLISSITNRKMDF